MFISIKSVQQYFSKYKSHLKEAESNICLTGWLDLNSAPKPFFPHLLYFTDNFDELEKADCIDNMFILCIVDEDDDFSTLSKRISKNINALLMKADDINAIKQGLIEFFNINCGVGLFSDSLLEILCAESGTQVLVNRGFNMFGNPIFVFDAGFNLIACTWEEAEKTPTGRRIINSKGFSSEDYEIINHLEHIHEKVKKSERPLVVHHPEFDIDQMICAISTKKDIGHIVINAVNKPFCDQDYEFMMRLKRSIEQQLRKEEFIQANKGFPYEYFLKDLLDGKIASAGVKDEKFSFVNKEFSGTLFCLVVESARSLGTLNKTYIRTEFEQAYPNTKTIIYNDEIIVIFSLLGKKKFAAKDYEKLDGICKSHNMYAGISNAFSSILDLPEFYKQSLRSIELGTMKSNKPSLFKYSDYYIDHITTLFAQKESADTFCHPKLKVLIEHDKTHSGNLAYTLYMYLICERNIAAASDKMFIHRNTMNYRMKKIDSLVDIDYENYSERQYLILSYELLEQSLKPNG
ncbi:MAG: helix-turn-helix domain-containing protein [Parasporobacterium sp.]|nr:helix-turn-helix domain-containing protein [Parasporobacterium sp.]